MRARACNCCAPLVHKLLACYEKFRRLSIVIPMTITEVSGFNTTSLISNSVFYLSVTSCGETIKNWNFPGFAFKPVDVNQLTTFSQLAFSDTMPSSIDFAYEGMESSSA